jgi:hypothetical protein
VVRKISGEEPYRSLGLAGISGKFSIEQLLSALRGKPITVYGGRKRRGRR